MYSDMMTPSANPKANDLAMVVQLRITSHMEETTLSEACPQSSFCLESLKADKKLVSVK
jgi:hypothetical protein